MTSATLIALFLANAWGIASCFYILRKLSPMIAPVGSIKVCRLIMYFTFAAVTFELWKRHVQFEFHGLL